VIRSRSGVSITIDDANQGEVTVETPGGRSVMLSDDEGTVELSDGAGNSVKLESAGITVTSSARVTLNASMVEIAAGMVAVNAGMASFSGIVKAQTLIADSVVASSYTPGAGNIW
jgi:hypothetical protein